MRGEERVHTEGDHVLEMRRDSALDYRTTKEKQAFS